jgi:hypothetical protein
VDARIKSGHGGSRVCVGWTTISSNAPGGWDGTTIAFALRAEGDDTVQFLVHRGFARTDEGYALVAAWSVCPIS